MNSPLAIVDPIESEKEHSPIFLIIFISSRDFLFPFIHLTASALCIAKLHYYIEMAVVIGLVSTPF